MKMRARHHGYASPPCFPTSIHDKQSGDSCDCSSYSATFAPSVASSSSTLASATSLSLWSDRASQQSDSTPSSISGSDSDSCGEYQDRFQPRKLLSGKLLWDSQSAVHLPGLSSNSSRYIQPSQPHQSHQETVPPELRKNPRRTSASSTSRGCPPTLFRQVDRKVEFVDKLVDSATYIVEAIWPTSSVPCRNDFGSSSSVLPLRKFIEETLRRSRTSYSTLQVGLYYLILIKPHVPSHDFTMEQTDESHASRVLQCGRRMFLAALILASKWLQDRNYSARAWSRISGLKISEINENEIAFLVAVNWKLHIGEDLYNTWSDCVMKYTPSLPPPPGSGIALERSFERQCGSFKKLIQELTPELDNLDAILPMTVKSRPKPSLALGVVPEHERSLTPMVMEPMPAPVCRPGRLVPALGLLPTPRQMISQTSGGFSTPAASAATHLLAGTSSMHSMSAAMSHAHGVSAIQHLDRWPAPVTSFIRTSPPSYAPTRRSSLANTVSTASSPESMVSDSSGNSRSSSIASSSVLRSAPHSLALAGVAEYPEPTWNGQQYRIDEVCEGQKAFDAADRFLGILTNDNAHTLVDSPTTYSHGVIRDSCKFSPSKNAKPVHPSQDDVHWHLSDRDAACALQELHNHREAPARQNVAPTSAPIRQGIKRNRPRSLENCALQDNVRDLLAGPNEADKMMWSESLVGSTLPRYLPASEAAGYAWSLRGTADSAATQSAAKRARLVVPHVTEAYGHHHLITSM